MNYSLTRVYPRTTCDDQGEACGESLLGEPQEGKPVIVKGPSRYIRTSPVKKIHFEIDNDDYREIVFETNNSVYSWREHKQG